MHPCGSTKESAQVTKTVGAFKTLSVDHAIWKCRQSEGSPKTSEAQTPEVTKTREGARSFETSGFRSSKELQKAKERTSEPWGSEVPG